MSSELPVLRDEEKKYARTPSSFWALYDRLLSGLPGDLRIDDFSAGAHWYSVRADGGLGFAMAPREGLEAPATAGGVSGSILADTARLSKSWNLAEAALGVAALNAFYNKPSRVDCLLDGLEAASFEENAFDHFLPRVAGKRVTVVGHFRNLERYAECCELRILERRPQPGDYPDPACEVLLPDSEYVFITGTTLINKTLPRLLELGRGAKIVLVGPTTPLCPLWFELGVHAIASLVVDDPVAVQRTAREGGNHALFGAGTRHVLVEAAEGGAA